MLRKGYLEQQIEGLAQALARLMGIGAHDKDAALHEIEIAGRDLAGLNIDTLLTLTDDSVLAMFTGGDRSRTAGNAYVCARLLTERAERDPAVARKARRKALLLFAEALHLERTLHAPQIIGQFAALLKSLAPTDFTPLLAGRLALAKTAIAEVQADRAEYSSGT